MKKYVFSIELMSFIQASYSTHTGLNLNVFEVFVGDAQLQRNKRTC